jgi:hypothetical protein
MTNTTTPNRMKASLKILSGSASITAAGAYIWNYGIPNITWNTLGYFLLASIILLPLAFGRKVWKKIGPQFEKDAVEASAGWLDSKLRSIFSGFRQRYYDEVIAEHNLFNVVGISTKGNVRIDLESIFVDLRIAPSEKNSQNPINLLKNEDLQGSKPIWEFLRILRRNGPKYAPAFAIIGAPGCGKTTLLQHLALIFSQNKQRPLKLPPYIPILLF